MAFFHCRKDLSRAADFQQPLVAWHDTAQAQGSIGDMHTHEEPLHPECHQAQQTHLFHAAMLPTLISIHLISLEAFEMLPSPSPHGKLKKLSLEKASQQDKVVVQPPSSSQQSRGGTGTALPSVPSNSQRNQSHIFLTTNFSKEQLKTTFLPFLSQTWTGLTFPSCYHKRKGQFCHRSSSLDCRNNISQSILI